jgi:riboflavin-specific deaminase-like protein
VRVVLPSESAPLIDLSDADLESLYPWPETGTHLRTNMVMTLTGAVADAAGSSRGISSPADRRLLGLLRRRCDALLVGAGTLRAENYAPLRAAYAESRIASGQRSAPVLAVVSNRLDLPLESPLFRESAERPVILTCTAAPTTARRAAAEVADIVDCGDSEVDLSRVPNLLAERGLPRIHCEGGPTLLTGLVTLDLVDELLLTLSPIATGTDTSNGTPLNDSQSFALTSVLEDAGSLFCRYRRTRTDEDAAHEH